MLNKSLTYYTVRITRGTLDFPEYLRFHFADYENAHTFATFACLSDNVIEAVGWERCAGQYVVKFKLT